MTSREERRAELETLRLTLHGHLEAMDFEIERQTTDATTIAAMHRLLEQHALMRELADIIRRRLEEDFPEPSQ